MKTTKKTKDVKTASTRRLSYYPSVRLDDSIKQFKEQALADVDASAASKNLVERVIMVIEVILKTKPNFIYEDVLRQAKNLDIKPEHLRPVYDRMTDYLCTVGKLEIADSLYGHDNKMFIVHA